jgi:hypothetical protein
MPCRQIGIHGHADRRPQSLSLDGGCHHDELNPTVLKVSLVCCACTVAAGICHSQMRHFEGICSLAGVEFFFACGWEQARRDNNMIAALVSVMRLPTRRFSRVCRQKLLQPCIDGNACAMQLLAMPNAAACVVPHTLVSSSDP